MSIIQTATLAWSQPAGAGSESAPAPAGVEGASEAQGGSGPSLGGCGAMGGYQGIIMMLAMFVIFYFLLIRPQQKKAKEHQKMLEAIKKGDEIVTTGGLIGRVTAVSGKTVTLEVSEKVRVRVARSQVAGPFAAETGEKK
ncbi:MAG TPA: preprotein translocase subunit YajC [Polyangia bacterium]|nr:preprotein translocase subunit YajC [Polyangia bacterium]